MANESLLKDSFNLSAESLNSSSQSAQYELFDKRFIIAIVPCSLIGFVGSLLILLIGIVRSSQLNGDFKFFLSNVSFMDIISSMTWLAYVVVAYLLPITEISVYVGSMLSMLLFPNFLSSVMVLLPNTLSRYVLFCTPFADQAYKKWFTRRRIIIYFIIVDIYSYILIVGLMFANMAIFALLFLLSFVIAYFLICFYSLKLYRGITDQIFNAGSTTRNKDGGKDIVKAFLYQACVPIVSLFPGFIAIGITLYLLGTGDLLKPYKSTDLRLYAYSAAALSSALNPIGNIIIVFLIIKPYRRALSEILLKFLPCQRASTTTSVANVGISGLHGVVTHSVNSVKPGSSLIAVNGLLTRASVMRAWESAGR